MAAKLPMLCLQRIFEELRPLDLTTSYSYLFSCTLVNRYWSDIAISILWRHPFERQWWSEPATKLLDIYISHFPKDERKLFINDNSITKYERPPSHDYVSYLRSLKTENLSYATTNWLRNKPTISTDFKIIYEIFCRFFIRYARNLELLEYETSNKINIFELSGATSSLLKLKSLVVIDQDYPTRSFITASKVSKNVQTLDITINNHIPRLDLAASVRINDLMNLVSSQKSLKDFILKNEHPKCGECGTRDQSGVLDFRIVFESLIDHALTLSRVELGWVDFHGEFPFLQLAECKNLRELYLDRCQNFGNQDYKEIDSTSFGQLFKLTIKLTPFPASILCKILTNAGKSLKYLHLDQRSFLSSGKILKNTIQICTLNNPNLLKLTAYIYTSEISNLPNFFSICQKLKGFEIWDINTSPDNDFQSIFQLNSLIITDVESILPLMSTKFPPHLVEFEVNMNWKFSEIALAEFIRKIRTRINFLGFRYCNCFTESHFEVLAEHLKHPLKILDISQRGDNRVGDISWDLIRKSRRIINRVLK
ncbi:23481_t:CDS:1 [Gigaspora margarita]|uniref:23481_t:CDS:1 n=1 Tax=Gigaspora margarita TaxID=4874 RepID=A0ABM8W6W8_GIGMA|nr:23481_t:CDS:1 [Gigaspora margarita]